MIKSLWGGRVLRVNRGEFFTVLDTVGLWQQGNAVPREISKSWQIPQLMGSFRRTLTACMVWSRTCSKAGLPFHTIIGTGHDGCFLPGMVEGM